VLVGSGNPEEGELRPQLLDRFGLSVEVRSPRDIATRVEVVLRREAYEADPLAFAAEWAKAETKLRASIVKARTGLAKVQTPRAALEDCAALCIHLGSDGVRGELTLLRAARAYAASLGAKIVTRRHIHRIAAMALGHRLRRDPLDEAGSTDRVARALSDVLAL
jgi:magnesium chelatase subunit I